MTTISKSEFIEEVTSGVEKIITEEYRNISQSDVLRSLYKECQGDPSECSETMIRETIENLGGEPYDPDVDEVDYEDDDEEGDEYDDEDY